MHPSPPHLDFPEIPPPPILKLGSPQAAQLITDGKCFAYRDWHEANWNACPGHVVVEM